MKKLVPLFFVFMQIKSIAQVGIGTTTPNTSSLFDVTSTTKGLLVPRMTAAQKLAIVTPANGLLIYQTNLIAGFYYYNGTAWVPFLSPSWNLTGNTGTSVGTNFLGTTDNVPLEFRVNNTRAGYISNNSLTDFNTFLGYSSGNAVTFGNRNTAIGALSLGLNTGGNELTAIGYNALGSNTTFGLFNTAVGANALFSNTTGDNNVAVGRGSLQLNITGNNSVGIGALSLFNNLSGNNLTAVGFNALNSNTTGTENTAVGSSALVTNTTGIKNTAIGESSLKDNSTGSFNVAIGSQSLFSNTTVNNLTAIGFNTMSSNTTGTGNTAVGSNALETNSTGNNNTAVGYFVLQSNLTGVENTALGTNALQNSTGSSNTGVGYRTLVSNFGNQNTAVGKNSLSNNNSGSNNVAIGNDSGLTNITGSNNVTLGNNANVTGSSLSNAIAIGSGSNVNASNKIRLGNAAITVIEGQVAYTITSDARFKENIKYDDVPGLNFIKELKPVTYTFDTKKFDEHLMQNMEAEMRNERLQNEDYKASSAIKHSGFLAQDIESTCKKLNYEFDGLHTPDAMNKTDHYSVAYSQFIMPLVKAVQELQVLIEKVQQENDQLRKEIVAVNTNVALLLKK